MAMFLSRIKKALNLGTKSITQNGTYNASSDGYDGYSSVEVNVAGVTPTPITPSNASPAALTSGSAVTPSANGYAIESYHNCSPSSMLNDTFTTDDIVRFRGAGIIVDSIASITPDNSDPPQLQAAKDYFSMRAGYAISGYQSVTPSNSSPISIGSGGIYKPSASGYIIKSLSGKYPSDTVPDPVSSGEIIKASASGYLYSTVQPKVKKASVTLSTSTSTKVTLGWKPKYVCVYSTTAYYSSIYDESLSTTQYIRATSSGPLLKNLDTNYSGGLKSIDNDGFTLRYTNSSAGTNWSYFAIG